MKEKIDVVSFFTNSQTVWVSENFQNLILDKYVASKGEHKSGAVNSLDLRDTSNEADPQAFIFQDADIFLEQLIILIQGQINGEAGRLLNDSSANYFFLKAKDGNLYSALVRWEPAQKLWRCGAYLQEEMKMPNIRIFYPER